MKRLKNIFKIFTFLLVLFLVAAITIPILMKDELIAALKEEVNASVNAKVDFQDAELSLLRHFPSLSLHIDELTVDGIEAFADTRLLYAPATRLELDFLKVWNNRSSLPLESFTLESPQLNLLVQKNGKTNWDIFPPLPLNAEPVSYLIEMKDYQIKNGFLKYADESQDLHFEMEQINHSGKGNFSASVFDLDTQTETPAVSLQFDGIDYLKKAKANLDALVSINREEMKFQLKDNQLILNELIVRTDGFFDINEEDFVLDLQFSSPQNSFKNLWSIVPAAYTADYEAARIDGKMAIQGMLKGTLNASQNIYPAFQIHTQIDNGRIQYPQLPTGIKNIFANLNIHKPGTDFDDLEIRVPQFEFQLKDNPFAGNFILTKPISDPTLKTQWKGRLNLADLNKAIPMDQIKDISGIIDANFYINGAHSQIQKGNYEDIDLQGQLSLSDVIVESSDFPRLTVHTLQTDFAPQSVKLENIALQFGKSDLRGAGRINNILAYFNPQKVLEGYFTLEANYLDANEWMQKDTSLQEEKLNLQEETQNNDQETAPPLFRSNQDNSSSFNRFHFDLNGTVDQLDIGEYSLTDLSFKGAVDPQESQIDQFHTKIGDSDLRVKGYINNFMGYFLHEEKLDGTLHVEADYLDLNQFTSNTEPSDEMPEIIPIPEQVDLKIEADLKKVHYTNFDLENLNGWVVVREGQAILKDVKGNLLGGTVSFDGAYDTKNPEKPGFNLKSSLSSLNFNTAFQTFNTFEQIAPIGKFIEGRFNTTLSMDGFLGKNSFPEMSSLNFSGFFHTLEGVISGFQPIIEMANKLNLQDKLKAIPIKDSKNWIDVENGFVKVREFKHTFEGMTFQIGGNHSLEGQLDYLIKASIPRELMEQNKTTDKVNQLLENLSKEASKKGIDLGIGPNIRLHIKIGGTMNQPTYQFTPANTEGKTSLEEATRETVGNVVEEVKDSVATEIDSRKDSIIDIAEDIKDTTTAILDKKAEELEEVVKTTTGELLDSLSKGGKINLPKTDSLGKILKDTTLNKELEKAKNRLKDLFRKKKNE